MPTIISHAICGAAVAQILAPCAIRREATIVASVCAMLPDLDGIGLRFGIPYGSMWGHRGLTHSLLFAAIVATLVVVPFSRRLNAPETLQAFISLFVATSSHGILDAFTTGGMGVALFSPFDESRIFFQFRPIRVSPLSASALIGHRGIEVFRSEILWVWLPSAIVASAARVVRCRANKRTSPALRRRLPERR
jgi:inner membrane protein